MKFVCAKCGHAEEVNTKKMKCDCGGLWKIILCSLGEYEKISVNEFSSKT